MATKVSVPKWKSVDGGFFDTKEEAVEHDIKSDIRALVDDFFFNGISSKDITDEICERRGQILKIICKNR